MANDYTAPSALSIISDFKHSFKDASNGYISPQALFIDSDFVYNCYTNYPSNTNLIQFNFPKESPDPQYSSPALGIESNFVDRLATSFNPLQLNSDFSLYYKPPYKEQELIFNFLCLGEEAGVTFVGTLESSLEDLTILFEGLIGFGIWEVITGDLLPDFYFLSSSIKFELITEDLSSNILIQVPIDFEINFDLISEDFIVEFITVSTVSNIEITTENCTSDISFIVPIAIQVDFDLNPEDILCEFFGIGHIKVFSDLITDVLVFESFLITPSNITLFLYSFLDDTTTAFNLKQDFVYFDIFTNDLSLEFIVNAPLVTTSESELEDVDVSIICTGGAILANINSQLQNCYFSSFVLDYHVPIFIPFVLDLEGLQPNIFGSGAILVELTIPEDELIEDLLTSFNFVAQVPFHFVIDTLESVTPPEETIEENPIAWENFYNNDLILQSNILLKTVNSYDVEFSLILQNSTILIELESVIYGYINNDLEDFQIFEINIISFFGYFDGDVTRLESFSNVDFLISVGLKLNHNLITEDIQSGIVLRHPIAITLKWASVTTIEDAQWQSLLHIIKSFSLTADLITETVFIPVEDRFKVEVFATSVAGYFNVGLNYVNVLFEEIIIEVNADLLLSSFDQVFFEAINYPYIYMDINTQNLLYHNLNGFIKLKHPIAIDSYLIANFADAYSQLFEVIVIPLNNCYLSSTLQNLDPLFYGVSLIGFNFFIEPEEVNFNVLLKVPVPVDLLLDLITNTFYFNTEILITLQGFIDTSFEDFLLIDIFAVSFNAYIEINFEDQISPSVNFSADVYNIGRISGDLQTELDEIEYAGLIKLLSSQGDLQATLEDLESFEFLLHTIFIPDEITGEISFSTSDSNLNINLDSYLKYTFTELFLNDLSSEILIHVPIHGNLAVETRQTVFYGLFKNIAILSTIEINSNNLISDILFFVDFRGYFYTFLEDFSIDFNIPGMIQVNFDVVAIDDQFFIGDIQQDPSSSFPIIKLKTIEHFIGYMDFTLVGLYNFKIIGEFPIPNKAYLFQNPMNQMYFQSNLNAETAFKFDVYTSYLSSTSVNINASSTTIIIESTLEDYSNFVKFTLSTFRISGSFYSNLEELKTSFNLNITTVVGIYIELDEINLYGYYINTNKCEIYIPDLLNVDQDEKGLLLTASFNILVYTEYEVYIEPELEDSSFIIISNTTNLMVLDIRFYNTFPEVEFFIQAYPYEYFLSFDVIFTDILLESETTSVPFIKSDHDFWLLKPVDVSINLLIVLEREVYFYCFLDNLVINTDLRTIIDLEVYFELVTNNNFVFFGTFVDFIFSTKIITNLENSLFEMQAFTTILGVFDVEISQSFFEVLANIEHVQIFISLQFENLFLYISSEGVFLGEFEFYLYSTLDVLSSSITGYTLLFGYFDAQTEGFITDIELRHPIYYDFFILTRLNNFDSVDIFIVVPLALFYDIELDNCVLDLVGNYIAPITGLFNNILENFNSYIKAHIPTYIFFDLTTDNFIPDFIIFYNRWIFFDNSLQSIEATLNLNLYNGYSDVIPNPLSKEIIGEIDKVSKVRLYDEDLGCLLDTDDSIVYNSKNWYHFEKVSSGKFQIINVQDFTNKNKSCILSNILIN